VRNKGCELNGLRVSLRGVSSRRNKKPNAPDFHKNQKAPAASTAWHPGKGVSDHWTVRVRLRFWLTVPDVPVTVSV